MGEAGEVVVESVGAEGAGVVNMVWRAEPTAVEHSGVKMRCEASQTSNLSASAAETSRRERSGRARMR